jgi:predicted lactoylglutathione lyase
MVTKAVAAGGKPAMDPIDNGFMYGSSFYDPAGHHWELLWMDPKAIEKPAASSAHEPAGSSVHA